MSVRLYVSSFSTISAVMINWLCPDAASVRFAPSLRGSILLFSFQLIAVVQILREIDVDEILRCDLSVFAILSPSVRSENSFDGQPATQCCGLSSLLRHEVTLHSDCFPSQVACPSLDLL